MEYRENVKKSEVPYSRQWPFRWETRRWAQKENQLLTLLSASWVIFVFLDFPSSSGSLHMQFRLCNTLPFVLQGSTFSSLLQCYLLREGFPDHPTSTGLPTCLVCFLPSLHRAPAPPWPGFLAVYLSCPSWRLHHGRSYGLSCKEQTNEQKTT